MSWLLLILGVLSLTSTANAFRPLRRPWWLKGMSFLNGWFASELALHVLVGQAVVAAFLVWRGALDETRGVVGLGLLAVSWLGLLVLTAAHGRAGTAVERALREALGPDYRDRIAPHLRERLDERVPVSQLLAPTVIRRRDVEHVKDLRYGDGDDHFKLDVYRRRDHPTGCPTLLEIHGGAWVMGDKNYEARPLMTRLAAHGWVCVSANYRLSPAATWPDHVVDAKRALAWVRANIAQYGGDPDFVVVTGGSAGGHLASLVALTPGDPAFQPGFEDADTAVQACVPFYGAYDFANRLGTRARGEVSSVLERRVVKARIADAGDLYDAASPLTRVTADAPPFLVVQGGADNLVQPVEARTFADELRRVSRSPVAYAEVPLAHHAFDFVTTVRTAHTVRGVERFAAWAYSDFLARRGEPARALRSG